MKLILAIAVVVVLAFVGLERASRSHVPVTSMTLGAVVPDAALQQVSAPDSMLEIQGLRGKVVLIDVWATWCYSCKASLPPLVRLEDSLKSRGFQVVHIAYNKLRDSLAIYDFMRSAGVHVTAYIPEDSDFYRDYVVFGVPHSYLIGRDGRLAWVGIGAVDSAQGHAILAEGGHEALKNALEAPGS